MSTATVSNKNTVTHKYNYNRKVTVNDLQTEANMLQAINNFRRNNNLSNARNAYSWWKYILTAIAFSKDDITVAEACDLVENRLNVRINRSVIGQLVKAIKGQTPCEVRREYTTSLPFLVKAMDLHFQVNKSTGRGRPSYSFYFVNREKARKVLFATFPETKMLFDTLRLTPEAD